jgi:hypothetical protein
MCLAFLDHIVATSTDAGLDPGLAGMVRDASARAMADRPGDTDRDVVAEEVLGSISERSRPPLARPTRARSLGARSRRRTRTRCECLRLA